MLLQPSNSATAPVTSTFKSESGTSTFHPKCMSWSYLSLGSVARVQMKKNAITAADILAQAVMGQAPGLNLILYGVIPTLQTSHFRRIYAVYGGFFIVLS